MEKPTVPGGAKASPTSLEGSDDAPAERIPAGPLPSTGAPFRYGDLGPRQPGRHGAGAMFAAFLPNRAVSPAAMSLIIAVEVAVFLAFWFASPFKVLPRPMEVLSALQVLWTQEGLGPELMTSLMLSLEALAWTAGISLALSYLTVLPVFRPLVAAISKGRFLSLVGFTFVFTLMVGGGHPLKLWLLVFAETVFFVTSMASVISQIPKESFDYARTLRMGEWRVVWEVVVLGTASSAFEVLRQNAAIGWMMLTMVEGLARAEGGVGTVLLNESKHFRLAEVFAIQLVILAVGLVQDYGIGLVRGIICPYADLTLERK